MLRPVALALLLSVLAGGARALPDDERRLPDPPPSLPESVNGTLRAAREGARTVRIERIRDVFGAVRACWRLPPSPEPTGQEITLRLSFKRGGELLGRPRITYAALRGDEEARRRFVRSALAALESCLPLPFSPAFGAAIAGRPFTFRFVDDRAA